MERKKQLFSAATAFCIVAFSSYIGMAATDTIALKGNKIYKGDFMAFKNNRFYFQPTEGKELHKMKIMVESVELNPAAKVSVKPFGKKKRKDLKFKRYEKFKFVFEKDGKEIIIPKVSIITMGLDFRRSEEQTADKKLVTDIEKLIKSGVTTIIHIAPQGKVFKSTSLMASTRTENYLRSLEKKYRGKVKIIKIPISSWEDQIALQYKITSAPQFWFYNRSGKLSTKLIERFTSQDIDKALKSARK